MNITRTTEPQSEPVTLDEAKAHLRVIDDTAEDIQIGLLISVARRAVEDMTGRTLLDTVFTQSLRDWHGCVELLRGNAYAVESIVYDDQAGDEQTVDPTQYGIHPYGDGCASVALYDEFTAPALVDRPFMDRIRIQFRAGYGGESVQVPEPLRQAVLYLVAHYYDNRGAVVVGASLAQLPFAVEALCGPYKIYN